MNDFFEAWWNVTVKPLQERVADAITELDQVKKELAGNGKDNCNTVLYQKIASTHESLKALRQDKLFDDQDELLLGLRQNIESARKDSERQAIISAIARLVEKLLENDGANILELGLDLSRRASTAAASTAAASTAAASTAATAEVAISAEDMPWIESNECTSCDDCTNINRSIFAYDENELAIIRDPRGGPFRDIVKAAEKCPSDIIHPGKPLNPKEKDLAKWLKRAANYQ